MTSSNFISFCNVSFSIPILHYDSHPALPGIVFDTCFFCGELGIEPEPITHITHIIPNAPNDSNAPTRELNLPRIATQSILGFGQWRFGRVCKRPLLSPAAPVLCFTEQLSSLVSNSIAIFRRK